MENSNLQLFLRKLNFLLECSDYCYAEYTKNGKNFKEAKLLFHYNTKVRILIEDYGHDLPLKLRKDAISLLNHYHSWSSKWVEERNRLKPNNNDIFSFSDYVLFPKQAAINLIKELHQ